MTTDTHDRGYSVAQFVVVILILGGLVVGAGLFLSSRIGDGTVATSAIPPAGQVWFGASFDPTTYAMTGQTSSVGTQQPVALVAHLTSVSETTGLSIRASHDGAFVQAVPVTLTAKGDVVGLVLGALVVPGAWRYDLTDIGGNVLASGTVVAR